MTIILSYVKNLENNVNNVDKNQNIMGENISNIANMLLNKINTESSKIDDNKSNMEDLLNNKTDMLLNEINNKTEELDNNQNNMGENISKITNMLSSRINSQGNKLQQDIRTVLIYLKNIENKNKQNDNINEFNEKFNLIDNKINELNINNDGIIKAISSNRKYVDSITGNLKQVATFIKESASIKLYTKLSQELDKVRYEYRVLNSYQDISGSKSNSFLSMSDKIKFNKFYDDLVGLKESHYDVLQLLGGVNENCSTLIIENKDLQKRNEQLIEENKKITTMHNKLVETNTELLKVNNLIKSKLESLNNRNATIDNHIGILGNNSSIIKNKINTLFNANNTINNKTNALENHFKLLLTYVKSMESKIEEISLSQMKQDVSNEIEKEINKNLMNRNALSVNNSIISKNENVSLEIKEI